MWISHPSFYELVFTIWKKPILGNPQFILFQKLKSLRNSLKRWNKDYFGNVEQKIHQKEDSILALQIDMDSNPLDGNYTLLKDAKSALHNLLQAEETCWK